MRHCSRNAIREDGEAERIVQAAEGAEPGLVLQRVVELLGRQAALAQDVEQRARIHRSGTRRHRDALERAEAHRRVDRGAVKDRRHRSSRPKVAHDDALRIHLLDDRLHAMPWNRSAGSPTRCASASESA